MKEGVECQLAYQNTIRHQIHFTLRATTLQAPPVPSYRLRIPPHPHARLAPHRRGSPVSTRFTCPRKLSGKEPSSSIGTSQVCTHSPLAAALA